MKIAGAVIQNKNIKVNTESEFEAIYKGRRIYICTDHGFGKAKYDHLTRYDITVRDGSGMYDVESYEDLHTMRDAIIYALKGALLIP